MHFRVFVPHPYKADQRLVINLLNRLLTTNAKSRVVRDLDRLLGLDDQIMFLPVWGLAAHQQSLLFSNSQSNRDSSLAMSRRTNHLTINSPLPNSLIMEPANGLAMGTAMADLLFLRTATRSRNKRLTPKTDLHAHLSDLPLLPDEVLRLTIRNKWPTCILS